MAANTQPIFTNVPIVTATPVVLTTAANDYTGLSPSNALIFTAGANGAFIQRIRFKAVGTNVASVARIFINPGNVGHLASLLAAPGTPSGTPSSSGGTLLSASTYFAQIVAVDATGALSTASAASSAVTVSGPTGSIAWSWTASSGAASYRIYVSQASGTTMNAYFTSATNSYTQTAPQEGSGAKDGIVTTSNNLFFEEVALPVTTAIATTSTVTIDLPINFAIPANAEIYAGLGTTVAAGWSVAVIAGNY